MINPFEKRQRHLEFLRGLKPGKKKQRAGEAPEKLFCRCKSCGADFPARRLGQTLYCCPECGTPLLMPAPARIAWLCEKNSFRALDPDVVGCDPLEFPQYEEKLSRLRGETGLCEAVITGLGRIGGCETAIAAMDGRFLMGSMGAAVGEKITRLAEAATAKELPLVIFCCSGGARMQEGAVSLMQMAKTAAAIRRHGDAGLLYISVLTNPTTGGVTASFASLGDLLLAEPGALIGFAGPRVIEQTIRQKLPEGFQKAETLLKQGFLDVVVPRSEMKETIGELLRLHQKGGGKNGA